jgi:hypothetical protein
VGEMKGAGGRKRSGHTHRGGDERFSHGRNIRLGEFSFVGAIWAEYMNQQCGISIRLLRKENY